MRVPIRPHFGVIVLAPKEADIVDSIPPSYTGGNIDNWRIGKGATMYYPVAVDGALISVGDPHASQGDSELCGTAIECSLTGTFQMILHKKVDLAGTAREKLDYPMLETQNEWLVHGFSFANYLSELGAKAQSEIYSKSSIDLALRDAFHKMRHFLMNHRGPDGGRSNPADHRGVRFRHHPGGRRQLGRARRDPQGYFRRGQRLRPAAQIKAKRPATSGSFRRAVNLIR